MDVTAPSQSKNASPDHATTADQPVKPLSEFDQYARDYLQQLDHPLRRIVSSGGSNYFIRLKCDQIRSLMRAAGIALDTAAALDVGSGIGLFEQEFDGALGSLCALDLSRESLKVSRFLRPHAPREHYICSDALTMPLPANSMDIVFSSCMYHHMPHDLIPACVREMVRVVKPGGYVVVFEHNPYNPLTQLVVRTTPLDQNAVLLRSRTLVSAFEGAGLEAVTREFILYGPEFLDKVLNRVAPFLRRLPFGGQYQVAGRKRQE